MGLPRYGNSKVKPSGLGTQGAGRFQNMFRAFRYRNYRLFFFGQGISLLGTSTQMVALSWLVYRLTGSTLLLGTVAFCNQAPMLFLGPFSGVLADRFDRKRLLLLTQGLAMVQAFILAGLVLARIITPWEIIALSILMGIIDAFDVPTRQSFVIAMVESKDDLGSAIALGSAIFNCARFIGPSIAGLLISAFGEGICFLVNGISFVAVLGALQAIRVAKKEGGRQNGRLLGEFREAVAYACKFGPIIAILGLLAIFAVAFAPFVVLMPVYAKVVLHGNATTYGLLMSSSGLGAIAGALYLASRNNAHGLIKVLPVTVGISGSALAALALSHTFELSLFVVFLADFAMMTHIASSNTLIQTVVDEDKRGRVMSFHAMSFMGVMPFGSLLAGGIAGKIGVQNTLLLGAALCLTGALIFASRLPRFIQRLQPIFAEMAAYSSAKNNTTAS